MSSTTVLNAETQAPIFQAAWPESLDPANKAWYEQIFDIAVFVLKIVLFPLYLCYAGLRKLACMIILPASTRNFGEGYDAQIDQKIAQINQANRILQIGRVAFKTPDGLKIDGHMVRPQPPANNPAERKALIYLCGNGMRYDNFQYTDATQQAVILTMMNVVLKVQSLLRQNTSIMFLNYRGVGASEGSPEIDKLPLDVYSAYEYLYRVEGIAPGNIAFCGFSMGGGVGSVGAALVQEKYPEAPIGGITLSTYARLSTEAGALMGKCANFAIRFLGLEVNAAKAWATLTGPKLAIHNTDDEVIPYHVSLAAEAQDSQRVVFPAGLEHSWEDENHHYLEPDEIHALPALRQTLRLSNPI